MRTIALRRMRRRRGFTLMEILLVLAILVILGALVGVGYSRIRENALIDTAKAQISTLESAVKVYQMEVGTYPSMDAGLDALFNPPADTPPNKWRGPYLEGTQLPLDPWNNPYEYELYNDNQFEITSNGRDGQPGTDDDVRIIR
ncbi:MAG: type II secretion system major pseudopilin GspG [Pirellulaceae bacterium]